VVIYLEQGADLHLAQLMPLPLTVSCFRKIQIDLTFLGSPGKTAVKWVCVCIEPGQLGFRVAGFPGHWVAGSQNMTQFHVGCLLRGGAGVL